jgi:hypothetical protein
VHEEGFQVERLASGELEFRRADGRVLPDVPRLPRVPADVPGALCEQNVSAGAQLDAHTLRPDWDGTRFDVGYAISVMHPLATRPSHYAGSQ